tara:strand:+ start:280 stop:498 length:219 start_codon:yes stop_codon:yes gene_type:complete
MDMDTERWHLSKAISVSHIATTATMILLMIMYVTSIERDVAVLKSQQETNQKKFDSIDIKLDKILDRLIQRE